MTGLQRAEKEEIANRASTLQERLDAGEVGPADGDRAADVIEKWREYVASGDAELFSERVAREASSLEECRHRIARDEWPADEELPDWIAELDAIVARAGSSRSAPSTDLDGETPFVHVLEPLVTYAADSLSESVSDVATESALRDLRQWLADDLSSLFSHTLFIEFKSYVATNAPDGEADPTDESDTERYDTFVAHTVENFADLFVEYSFLGRLAATTVAQWRSAVEEVCDRLADDWAAIEELVEGANDARRVVGVDVLGDSHVGGRRVMKLAFDGGGSVAYKPRSSGITAGFNDLLRWINENGQLPDLATLRTVCRDGYSWMEWVEPEECRTSRDVADYYRRAGMLTCLFYATNVVDMHLENIVAAGSHPVVIDLETLAHPTIDDEYRITDRERDGRDTVLRTGAVPENDGSADLLDVSCFSTSSVTFTSSSHDFVRVNSDAMELTDGTDVVADGDNLPRREGEEVPPDEHVREIVRGFGDMYEFIRERADELLAEDGPISRLPHGDTRVSVLYRNSRNYSAIRQLLTHQPNLRTGLQFGVKAESLAGPILSQDVSEQSWNVYGWERDTLRNWNCPRFTCRLNERNLYHRDELVVTDLLDAKPIEQVRRRIRGFDEVDLERQQELVRRGFTA